MLSRQSLAGTANCFQSFCVLLATTVYDVETTVVTWSWSSSLGQGCAGCSALTSSPSSVITFEVFRKKKVKTSRWCFYFEKTPLLRAPLVSGRDGTDSESILIPWDIQTLSPTKDSPSASYVVTGHSRPPFCHSNLKRDALAAIYSSG